MHDVINTHAPFARVVSFLFLGSSHLAILPFLQLRDKRCQLVGIRTTRHPSLQLATVLLVLVLKRFLDRRQRLFAMLLLLLNTTTQTPLQLPASTTDTGKELSCTNAHCTLTQKLITHMPPPPPPRVCMCMCMCPFLPSYRSLSSSASRSAS